MSARQTATSRRRREQAEARRNRLIMGGVVVVLAAVVAVIAAGLFITQYLPPRAHVVAIEGVDFDASAVRRRATYYVLFEGGIGTSITAVPSFTVDLLVREAALRAGAPALVGSVSEEQMDQELRERLGFADSDDAAGFARALQGLLRGSGLDRDEFFALLEGQMLVERLRGNYREEIGETARQLDLSRIGVDDEETAEALRDRASEGEGFVALAEELASDPEADVELGWIPVDLLDDDVIVALEGLGRGDVSEPVSSGLSFQVYLVGDVEDARELTGPQLDGLVLLRLEAWLDQEMPQIAVERDLSDDEQQWIADGVLADVARALGR